MEVCGRTSSLLQYPYIMPKTINIGLRWDTTHATEAPPTINLPSSRKFWGSPRVSNPLSYIRLFSLAFFCSASTQTVLTHTVSSNRVQRSLAVEALNHWTTHASCPTYSSKAAKLIHRDMTTISRRAQYRNQPYLARIFYGYAHFSWSHELYIAVTWKLNPKP